MDEVAEIKSRLEIAEVVGAYLPLKQAGRNLKAPCPFHEEKSASFMVSPEKGIYHCFGCGEGGDIFSFVMKMEGVDFRQALEMLARKAGIELTQRSENKEAGRLKARMSQAHDLAVQYFQASLIRNPKAAEYLIAQRKITKQSIKDFLIGYAPNSWNGLTDVLIKRGFAAQELVQAGLAGQRPGKQSVYDLFRGRIMFAICDREGRPLGFTGRVLDDSVPKYLNTPQTLLYDKSSAIYGLHLAKEAIRQQDKVVLVEGNMDVVASHQAGVRNVVATSGTALTTAQLRTLSKLTKNIVLAFDSDKAGLAATERAIDMGQQLGLMIRMIELTDAKDADELIRRNPAAWQEAIAKSVYIVDYLFNRFEQEYDLTSAVGKRGYADRLAGVVRRLGDPVEQDHYVQLLASKTGASVEAVHKKLEKPSASTTVSSTASSVRVDDGTARRAVVQIERRPTARRLQEESLLALGLMWPDCRAALADLDAKQFTDPARQEIAAACKRNPAKAGSALARSLTEWSDYIKILLLRGEQEFADLAPADRSFEAFELARRLQIAANKDNKKILSEKLREAEKNGDARLAHSLLRQYQALIDEEK